MVLRASKIREEPIDRCSTTEHTLAWKDALHNLHLIVAANKPMQKAAQEPGSLKWRASDTNTEASTGPRACCTGHPPHGPYTKT